MANTQQYEYENEESIDKNLRCAICDEPFIDPVSTPCHHCFCRECIRKWLQNYNATCPTCREKLEICSPTPITLLGFLRMLDEIPVKCKLCGQANLQRGNFQDHLRKYCSKTISSSADEDRKASHESIDEKIRAQSTTSDFELTGYEMIESESASGGTRTTENDSIFNAQRIDSNVVIMQLKSDFKDLSSQDIATASHKAITHQECTLLNLFNHPLLPENILLIVSALSPRTSLTTLELGKCALGDEGVRLLAENLSDRNSLECLDLYDNSITDIGVDYLSKMLMRNKSLRQLKLSHNQIGDYGMEILAHVLIQNNSTLKRLSVAGNTLIGDGSTDSICSIIRLNQGLKLLNLEDCNISPVDVATILLCKFMSFRLGLDIRS